MSPRPDAPFKDDLKLSLQRAFDMLARGAKNRRSPFHTPVFATQGGQFGVDARTVVLREFVADRRRLRFHTDTRTQKCAHVTDKSNGLFVFYDPGARIQLRAYGPCSLHMDDQVADDAWAQSQHFSRRCYMAPEGPGSLATGPTSGLPEAVEGRVPTEEETLAGRPHFSVMLTTITSLDWLFLAHDGHRRARFSWDQEGDGTGSCRKEWLIP